MEETNKKATQEGVKEAYCSYELSKLLKEKGFDGKCYYFHDGEDYLVENTSPENWNEDSYTMSIPTHQMAMAWLREKHHIYAEPIRRGNYDDCLNEYSWIVAKGGTIYRNSTVVDALSYEEASEAAIKYALENLI